MARNVHSQHQSGIPTQTEPMPMPAEIFPLGPERELRVTRAPLPAFESFPCYSRTRDSFAYLRWDQFPNKDVQVSQQSVPSGRATEEILSLTSTKQQMTHRECYSVPSAMDVASRTAQCLPQQSFFHDEENTFPSCLYPKHVKMKLSAKPADKPPEDIGVLEHKVVRQRNIRVSLMSSPHTPEEISLKLLHTPEILAETEPEPENIEMSLNLLPSPQPLEEVVEVELFPAGDTKMARRQRQCHSGINASSVVVKNLGIRAYMGLELAHQFAVFLVRVLNNRLHLYGPVATQAAVSSYKGLSKGCKTLLRKSAPFANHAKEVALACIKLTGEECVQRTKKQKQACIACFSGEDEFLDGMDDFQEIEPGPPDRPSHYDVDRAWIQSLRVYPESREELFLESDSQIKVRFTDSPIEEFAVQTDSQMKSLPIEDLGIVSDSQIKILPVEELGIQSDSQILEFCHQEPEDSVLAENIHDRITQELSLFDGYPYYVKDRDTCTQMSTKTLDQTGPVIAETVSRCRRRLLPSPISGRPEGTSRGQGLGMLVWPPPEELRSFADPLRDRLLAAKIAFRPTPRLRDFQQKSIVVDEGIWRSSLRAYHREEKSEAVRPENVLLCGKAIAIKQESKDELGKDEAKDENLERRARLPDVPGYSPDSSPLSNSLRHPHHRQPRPNLDGGKIVHHHDTKNQSPQRLLPTWDKDKEHIISSSSHPTGLHNYDPVVAQPHEKNLIADIDEEGPHSLRSGRSPTQDEDFWNPHPIDTSESVWKGLPASRRGPPHEKLARLGHPHQSSVEEVPQYTQSLMTSDNSSQPHPHGQRHNLEVLSAPHSQVVKANFSKRPLRLAQNHLSSDYSIVASPAESGQDGRSRSLKPRSSRSPLPWKAWDDRFSGSLVLGAKDKSVPYLHHNSQIPRRSFADKDAPSAKKIYSDRYLHSLPSSPPKKYEGHFTTVTSVPRPRSPDLYPRGRLRYSTGKRDHRRIHPSPSDQHRERISKTPRNGDGGLGQFSFMCQSSFHDLRRSGIFSKKKLRSLFPLRSYIPNLYSRGKLKFSMWKRGLSYLSSSLSSQPLVRRSPMREYNHPRRSSRGRSKFSMFKNCSPLASRSLSRRLSPRGTRKPENDYRNLSEGSLGNKKGGASGPVSSKSSSRSSAPGKLAQKLNVHKNTVRRAKITIRKKKGDGFQVSSESSSPQSVPTILRLPDPLKDASNPSEKKTAQFSSQSSSIDPRTKSKTTRETKKKKVTEARVSPRTASSSLDPKRTGTRKAFGGNAKQGLSSPKRTAYLPSPPASPSLGPPKTPRGSNITSGNHAAQSGSAKRKGNDWKSLNSSSSPTKRRGLKLKRSGRDTPEKLNIFQGTAASPKIDKPRSSRFPSPGKRHISKSPQNKSRGGTQDSHSPRKDEDQTPTTVYKIPKMPKSNEGAIVTEYLESQLGSAAGASNVHDSSADIQVNGINVMSSPDLDKSSSAGQLQISELLRERGTDDQFFESQTQFLENSERDATQANLRDDSKKFLSSGNSHLTTSEHALEDSSESKLAQSSTHVALPGRTHHHNVLVPIKKEDEDGSRLESHHENYPQVSKLLTSSEDASIEAVKSPHAGKLERELEHDLDAIRITKVDGDHEDSGQHSLNTYNPEISTATASDFLDMLFISTTHTEPADIQFGTTYVHSETDHDVPRSRPAALEASEEALPSTELTYPPNLNPTLAHIVHDSGTGQFTLGQNLASGPDTNDDAGNFQNDELEGGNSLLYHTPKETRAKDETVVAQSLTSSKIFQQEAHASSLDPFNENGAHMFQQEFHTLDSLIASNNDVGPSGSRHQQKFLNDQQELGDMKDEAEDSVPQSNPRRPLQLGKDEHKEEFQTQIGGHQTLPAPSQLLQEVFHALDVIVPSTTDGRLLDSKPQPEQKLEAGWHDVEEESESSVTLNRMHPGGTSEEGVTFKKQEGKEKSESLNSSTSQFSQTELQTLDLIQNIPSREDAGRVRSHGQDDHSSGKNRPGDHAHGEENFLISHSSNMTSESHLKDMGVTVMEKNEGQEDSQSLATSGLKRPSFVKVGSKRPSMRSAMIDQNFPQFNILEKVAAWETVVQSHVPARQKSKHAIANAASKQDQSSLDLEGLDLATSSSERRISRPSLTDHRDSVADLKKNEESYTSQSQGKNMLGEEDNFGDVGKIDQSSLPSHPRENTFYDDAKNGEHRHGSLPKSSDEVGLKYFTTRSSIIDHDKDSPLLFSKKTTALQFLSSIDNDVIQQESYHDDAKSTAVTSSKEDEPSLESNDPSMRVSSEGDLSLNGVAVKQEPINAKDKHQTEEWKEVVSWEDGERSSPGPRDLQPDSDSVTVELYRESGAYASSVYSEKGLDNSGSNLQENPRKKYQRIIEELKKYSKSLVKSGSGDPGLPVSGQLISDTDGNMIENESSGDKYVLDASKTAQSFLAPSSKLSLYSEIHPFTASEEDPSSSRPVKNRYENDDLYLEKNEDPNKVASTSIVTEDATSIYTHTESRSAERQPPESILPTYPEGAEPPSFSPHASSEISLDVIPVLTESLLRNSDLENDQNFSDSQSDALVKQGEFFPSMEDPTRERTLASEVKTAIPLDQENDQSKLKSGSSSSAEEGELAIKFLPLLQMENDVDKQSLPENRLDDLSNKVIESRLINSDGEGASQALALEGLLESGSSSPGDSQGSAGSLDPSRSIKRGRKSMFVRPALKKSLIRTSETEQSFAELGLQSDNQVDEQLNSGVGVLEAQLRTSNEEAGGQSLTVSFEGSSESGSSTPGNAEFSDDNFVPTSSRKGGRKSLFVRPALKKSLIRTSETDESFAQLQLDNRLGDQLLESGNETRDETGLGVGDSRLKGSEVPSRSGSSEGLSQMGTSLAGDLPGLDGTMTPTRARKSLFVRPSLKKSLVRTSETEQSFAQSQLDNRMAEESAESGSEVGNVRSNDSEVLSRPGSSEGLSEMGSSLAGDLSGLDGTILPTRARKSLFVRPRLKKSLVRTSETEQSFAQLQLDNRMAEESVDSGSEVSDLRLNDSDVPSGSGSSEGLSEMGSSLAGDLSRSDGMILPTRARKSLFVRPRLKKSLVRTSETDQSFTQLQLDNRLAAQSVESGSEAGNVRPNDSDVPSRSGSSEGLSEMGSSLAGDLSGLDGTILPTRARKSLFVRPRLKKSLVRTSETEQSFAQLDNRMAEESVDSGSEVSDLRLNDSEVPSRSGSSEGLSEMGSSLAGDLSGLDGMILPTRSRKSLFVRPSLKKSLVRTSETDQSFAQLESTEMSGEKLKSGMEDYTDEQEVTSERKMDDPPEGSEVRFAVAREANVSAPETSQESDGNVASGFRSRESLFLRPTLNASLVGALETEQSLLDPQFVSGPENTSAKEESSEMEVVGISENFGDRFASPFSDDIDEEER